MHWIVRAASEVIGERQIAEVRDSIREFSLMQAQMQRISGQLAKFNESLSTLVNVFESTKVSNNANVLTLVNYNNTGGIWMLGRETAVQSDPLRDQSDPLRDQSDSLRDPRQSLRDSTRVTIPATSPVAPSPTTALGFETEIVILDPMGIIPVLPTRLSAGIHEYATALNTPRRHKSKSTSSTVILKPVSYPITMRTIHSLSELPEAIHYFSGDATNPEGMYVRLHNNVVARIPFPEIQDRWEFDKRKTIRCKYGSEAACEKIKKKFDSNRACNYAHSGETLTKVATQARCPSVPNFGNPETLTMDITNVSTDDIQMLLLYGLSDIGAALILLDYHKIRTKNYADLMYA